jgi:hypothetical protein
MNTIKPLHSLTRIEIRELAHAAADRGELVAQANPYPANSTNGINFQHSYQERALELCEA